MALTEWEARQLDQDCYYQGESIEMTEEYTCPGCNALCADAGQFREHQQICAPALRARVAELEAENARLAELALRQDALLRRRETAEAE
jgi:hypothetical protein